MGPRWLTVWHDFSEVPFFRPPVIVRLFPRRFLHGPMVVNGMRVPLDMTDSKRKRNYIEKICLYNCFTHCIDLYGQ